jgi:archaellin
VNLYDFLLMFSMKTKFLSLVIVAIIFSMVMIVPSDMTQTADAAKAKGVKNQQYGQATSTKVCGDRLCTAEDFTKEGTKKEIAPTGKSSISSSIALSKMERLFEIHRVQLLSAWDSMSDSEKSHMLKMFDKMYEKMQSMSFSDHMKHMSKMMDGKHDMKSMHDKSGCSCGDGEHGCSCGDGEHGCSCGDGEHGCSCGDGEHGCSTLWHVKQVEKHVLVLKMEFVIVVQTANVLHAINEIIPKI